MTLWAPSYISIQEALAAERARYEEMGISRELEMGARTPEQEKEFWDKCRAWEKKHPDKPYGLALIRQLDHEAMLKQQKEKSKG